jgi:penicillin-binding protein 2
MTQRVALGPVSDSITDATLSQLTPVPGVVLFFQSLRVHPLGPAAAHVVGYTRELTAEELERRRGEGYEIGDRIGAVGLEASQDAILAGKVGAELRVVDGAGATLKVLAEREFVEGQDVQTTLDPATLLAAHARLGSRAGSAVVIDPRTNAILALNSSPAFDPDAFERNDAVALSALLEAPNTPQVNRATRGTYSAGSTFKLVTGAAGMAYGGYSPGDRLECGSIWRGIDPPRRNWEGGQGLLTIAEGLMRSCNPVFYQIGLDLYNETDGALSQMARQFGFGAPSGVDGLGEEAGLVPDAEWKRENRDEPWFPGDEVNLAIGQGDLLITPLQLANAYSTFLTRTLRNPVVLAGREATARGTLPLTDAQFAHLRLGLELVTSASGTASAAFANAGYTGFGGKSGTAEDAEAQQHVLFVAYGPGAAPTAVAAVVLDDGQSGSIEAGPIARDLVIAAMK